MEEYNSKDAYFYTQEHCTIYGHGVWHYLIDCQIGHIHIVEYEGKGMLIFRKYFEANDTATKYFQSICRKLLAGNML